MTPIQFFANKSPRVADSPPRKPEDHWPRKPAADDDHWAS